MARSYSIRTLFRTTPNPVLARFFSEKQIDFGLELDKEKASSDAIFDVWIELTEDIRHQVEPVFQAIFRLCCEKGIKSLLAEALDQDGAESKNGVRSRNAAFFRISYPVCHDP
jgi:hypothetical protein